MALIMLNVVAVVLETVPELAAQYGQAFYLFEAFSVGVFTLEYVLRLWACTERVGFQRPLTGRIRYALTPMALVDLLAIVPFFLPMLLAIDLRMARALRLLRMLRMFKLARYNHAMRVIGHVVVDKKEELVITSSFALVMLLFSSTVIYFLENGVQPNTFSSIPAAMWWTVATLTTVGYGDIYPITPLGKVFGAINAFLGIAFFALPAAILAGGFAEQLNEPRQMGTCPHCGAGQTKPDAISQEPHAEAS